MVAVSAAAYKLPATADLGHHRSRAPSPSSSEYSCDSDPPPNTLKHAATDRRRLAIVAPPSPPIQPMHSPIPPSRPLNIKSKNNSPAPPSIAVQSLSESPTKRNGISYLQYQPGLHATAGPLPPPPRATFPIDPGAPPPPRPPRMQTPNPRSRGDIEAVKQALQLPPSVSAALASRSLESSTSIEEEPEVKFSHRREGAFMPTPDLASIQASLSLKDTTADSAEKKGSESNDGATNHVVIVTPPPRHESLHTQDNAPDRQRTPSPVLVERPLSPDPGPSPPPKSFRNSLTSGLKRLSSISRSPSVSSRSPKRSSFGTVHSSRTPSPSYPYQQDLATPIQRKVIVQNPAALFCHEVYSTKSSSERCSIYIQKINDLYNCDPGLTDWLNDAKCRGSNSNTSPGNVPSSPSTDPFTPQRRHTSGSSMMTEATFPRRPDATTATDLTPTHRNITPPTAQPPPLPYPSLAIPQQLQRLPRSSSNTSNTPIISIRSLAPSTPSGALKGGFFASLGRRNSVSGRRDKPGITALSASNSQNGGVSLMKGPHQHQQPQQHTPRPVNVVASPSVPGGPRALPQRVKRSQTLMITPSPFLTRPPPEVAEHKDQLVRRPSTHNLLLDRHRPVVDVRPDPEFVRQVDRLADLLPHADRSILAAYLRRSGQDILAIGQYLEDEKNGTLNMD